MVLMYTENGHLYRNLRKTVDRMILHAIMILVEDTRYGKCVDEDSSPFRMPQRGMYFAGSILLWKENENHL